MKLKQLVEDSEMKNKDKDTEKKHKGGPLAGITDKIYNKGAQKGQRDASIEIDKIARDIQKKRKEEANEH